MMVTAAQTETGLESVVPQLTYPLICSPNNKANHFIGSTFIQRVYISENLLCACRQVLGGMGFPSPTKAIGTKLAYGTAFALEKV